CIGEQLGVGAPTEILLAPEQGRTRAWLYRLGAVLDEQLREDGSLALTVQADAELLARLARDGSGPLAAGPTRPPGFVAPPQGRP
ncbi:MAG: hypothetical protein GVY21_04605, partial [Gammaproteobacteria bacterium]|nr:hypothetical protein [Gammaproteobacteria bacterium]